LVERKAVKNNKLLDAVKAVKDKVDKPDKKVKESVSELITGVASELSKKFGAGTAMLFSANVDDEVKGIPFWVRTGLPALDYAIGGVNHPGLPGGRIIEISGAESSGKTTMAMWIMKCLIKMDGIAVLQDSEFAFSEERARQFNIAMDKIIYSNPETTEEVFEQQETIINLLSAKKNKNIVGIFWDSVASTSTKAELDGAYGQASMGVQARLMSQAMRKIKGLISKQRVFALYVNQVRDKIGVMFGEKTSTPGGRALKFFASVRIEVNQVEKLKKGDEIIGIRVKATVRKNKVAPPFKTAEFNIIFDEKAGGIDDVQAIIDWLVFIGKLQKVRDNKEECLEWAYAYTGNDDEVEEEISEDEDEEDDE